MWQQIEFEAEPLQGIANAMAKRSKALKHRFADVRLERDHDDRFTPPMERLCASFSRGHTTTARIELQVWANRWALVDARESSKAGWLWSFRSEGRIAGGKDGADLIRAIEDVKKCLPWGTSKGDLDGASSIWSKLLITGLLKSVP